MIRTKKVMFYFSGQLIHRAKVLLAGWILTVLRAINDILLALSLKKMLAEFNMKG